jgi:hypothetical protein
MRKGVLTMPAARTQIGTISLRRAANFRAWTTYRMVIRAARKSLQGEYDTVNMSASQAKHLQPDAKSSWWHDREQLIFWSALFATALFVFVAVSSATDGYIHPPLVTIGAPFAAIIGFPTFAVFGNRIIRQVRLWQVFLAVACIAALPIVVMQFFEINRTPPNVHTGTVVVFFVYAAFSELTAAAFLATTLVRIGLHRN